MIRDPINISSFLIFIAYIWCKLWVYVIQEDTLYSRIQAANRCTIFIRRSLLILFEHIVMLNWGMWWRWKLSYNWRICLIADTKICQSWWKTAASSRRVHSIRSCPTSWIRQFINYVTDHGQFDLHLYLSIRIGFVYYLLRHLELYIVLIIHVNGGRLLHLLIAPHHGLDLAVLLLLLL